MGGNGVNTENDTFTGGLTITLTQGEDGTISAGTTFGGTSVTTVLQLGVENLAGGGSIRQAMSLIGQAEKAPDPILLDLVGTGVTLTTLSVTSPYVDLSSDGIAQKTAWVGSGTGVLVIDQDGNPADATIIQGYAALKAYDTNGDGIISALDTIYPELGVLQGSGDNEVFTSLADMGIASISLTPTATDTVMNGSTITAIGSYTLSNGETFEAASANLEASSVYTEFETAGTVSSAIQALPYLQGYGSTPDLWTAMSNDGTLTNLVQAFSSLSSGTSIQTVMSDVSSIITEWTGTESVTGSTGYFQTQELDAIEALEGTITEPFIHGPRLGYLTEAWSDLEDGVAARLLLQSSVGVPFQSMFTYNQALDTIRPSESLTGIVNDMSMYFGAVSATNIGSWQEGGIILSGFLADYDVSPTLVPAMLTGSGSAGSASALDAIAQGMSISVNVSGTLVETGTNPGGGLSLLYDMGDGPVEMDVAPAYTSLAPVSGSTLYLGSGLTLGEMSETSDALGDVTLSFADGEATPDTIGLDGQFALGQDEGVQSIVFADGVTLSSAGTETGSTLETTLVGLGPDITFNPNGSAHEIYGVGTGNIIDFGVGDGAVTVTLNNGSGIVAMGAGITLSSLRFAQTSQGLLVSLAGDSADSLLLSNASGFTDIGDITFANGTSVSLFGLIINADGSYGGNGAVSVSGQNTFTVPMAQVAFGDSGSDTFVMSASSRAIGGSGGNRFVIPQGIGAATVIPNASASSNTLVLQGVTATSQVSLQVLDSAGDITVTDIATGDVVTVLGDLAVNAQGVTTSKVGNLDTGSNTVLESVSTANFDVDTVQDQVMVGDTLVNDVFHIGTDVDAVVGGSHANTYDFAAGDGDVAVFLGGTGNIVQMGTGIAPSNLIFEDDNTSGDLIAIDTQTGDVLTLVDDLSPRNAYGNFGSQVSSMDFTNGTQMSLTNLTYTWYDSAGVSLFGSDFGTNVFNAGVGAATVTGGADVNNLYDFDVGDGSLVINPAADGYQVLTINGPSNTNLTFSTDAGGDLFIADGVQGDEIEVVGDLSPSGYSYFGAQSKLSWYYNTIGGQISLNNLTYTWQAGSSPTVSGTSFGSNIFHDAAGIYTFDGGNVISEDYNDYNYMVGDGSLTINPSAQGSQELSLSGPSNTYLTYQTDTNGDIIITDGVAGDAVDIVGDLSTSSSGVTQSKLEWLFTPSGSQISASSLTYTWQAGSSPTVTGTTFGSNVFDDATGVYTFVGGNVGSNEKNYYNYTVGDGSLTLVLASEGNQQLAIGGPSSTSLTYEVDAQGDVYAYDGTGGDVIDITHELYLNANGQMEAQMQCLYLPNGTQVFLNSLTFQRYDGQDASANEVVGSPFGSNVLHMTPSDTLAVGANEGTNTFIDAAGAHTIVSGSGSNNIYRYTVGDGSLVIDPSTQNYSELDMIGPSNASLVYQADANGDLFITDGVAGDSVEIVGDLTSTWYGARSLLSALFTPNGSEVIVGNGSNLTFTSQASTSPTVVGAPFGAEVFNDAVGSYTFVGEVQNSNDHTVYNYTVGDGSLVVYASPQGYQQVDFIGSNSVTLSYGADAQGDLFLYDGVAGDVVELVDDLTATPYGARSQMGAVYAPNGTPLFDYNSPNLTFTAQASTSPTVVGSAFGSEVFNDASGSYTFVGEVGDSSYRTTYNYTLGDGSLVINLSPQGYQQLDLIGSSSPSLTYQADAQGDLFIRDGISGDVVEVVDDLTATSYGAHSSLTSAYMPNGNDIFLDNATTLTYTYTLSGSAVVAGSNFGPNIFIDTAGAHTVVGGSTKNTYDFASGNGSLTITPGTSGQDVISMGAGITQSNLLLSSDAKGDLILSVKGSSDVIDVLGDLTKSGGSVKGAMSGIQFYNANSETLGNQSTAGSVVTYGTSSATFIEPTWVSDTVVSGTGALSVTGGVGGSVFNFTAETSGTTDTLASAGPDTILAGAGTLAVTLSGGGVSIVGGSGALTISDTGVGQDTIVGGSGTQETIYAGAGGDSYGLGSGQSLFIGSGSSFTVVGGTAAGGVFDGGSGAGLYEAGSGGSSTLWGGSGANTLVGGVSGDQLFAQGSQSQVLHAGAGNETLTGFNATGSDTLIGGSGSDLLGVGPGGDYIQDGAGADSIQFTSGAAGGIYTVADFKQGTDVLLAPNGFSSVATQASDGNGGTLLTLSDGSRIDLLGIASIHASDFG